MAIYYPYCTHMLSYIQYICTHKFVSISISVVVWEDHILYIPLPKKTQPSKIMDTKCIQRSTNI